MRASSGMIATSHIVAPAKAGGHSMGVAWGPQTRCIAFRKGSQVRSIALGDPNPSRFRGHDIGATSVHVPIALEAPARAHGRLSTKGFTLFEIIAALGILGLVCSSVLLVIDRCVNSAADSSMRMEAFRLVRENLEEILVSDSVEETVEYGTSDEYPDISWETGVGALSGPP